MVSYLFYHLQFLENYFHQYKVPSGMKINDGIWKDLFREVVKRWLNNFVLSKLSCQVVYRGKGQGTINFGITMSRFMHWC